MKTLLFFALSIFLLAPRGTAQSIDNVNGNVVGERVVTPTNSVHLKVHEPLPVFPADNDPKRRFKAFWVMGDGNIREFADTPTDSESRNPGPYNYAAAGPYDVSMHLVGKYTDKTPPTTASRAVTANSFTPDARPTAFQPKLAPGEALGIFNPSALVQGYETPFVISYPSSQTRLRTYFFYNGRPQPGAPAVAMPGVLGFHLPGLNVPAYFKAAGMAFSANAATPNTIRNLLSSTLTTGLDGRVFGGVVQQLQGQFANFVFFPQETVTALPAGFTEKRHFPVLKANTGIAIPSDSMFTFLAITTGAVPVTDPKLQIAINSKLNELKLDIGFQNAFATNPQTDENEYIQAIVQRSVPYLKAHDPNQLTVEKIEPVGEKYLVTFLLEMCNKGGAAVHEETVTVRAPGGHFLDFRFVNEPGVHFQPFDAPGFPFAFKIDKIIVGIPENPDNYDYECTTVRFTATTDCAGVRSLWPQNAGGEAVEACVVFKDAVVKTPECHFNFPVDSTRFEVGGKCICCTGGGTVVPGGEGLLGCPVWVWVLLFLLLLLIFWRTRLQNI